MHRHLCELLLNDVFYASVRQLSIIENNASTFFEISISKSAVMVNFDPFTSHCSKVLD